VDAIVHWPAGRFNVRNRDENDGARHWGFTRRTAQELFARATPFLGVSDYFPFPSLWQRSSSLSGDTDAEWQRLRGARVLNTLAPGYDNCIGWSSAWQPERVEDPRRQGSAQKNAL